MATPRIIKPAIALSEAEERDAYPHPGRRLSKYEALYREKPLPKVPETFRRPSTPTAGRKGSLPLSYQTNLQQYSQPQTLPQASAASLVTLPLQDQWAVPGHLKTSRSLHISEVASSQSMAAANRKSSFSRGASGPRSSRKINSLIGHDLDLPSVDPSNPHDRTSFSSAAGYSEGASSSVSDSDDYQDGQSTSDAEGGLLPLLLEMDEDGLCRRSILWVPRTPCAMRSPPPLRIPKHGKSDNNGSVSLSNDGHSPTLGLSGGFDLTELPVRLTPGHGQFTDKRAANDYHRFAAELAAPCQIERASHPAAVPSARQQSPGPRSKKAKVGGKFRGTAAFIRLWDNPRPKEARPPTPPPMLPPLPSPSSSFSLIEPARSTSPTASFEEETVRMICLPRLSAVGVEPPSSPHQYRLFPRQNTTPAPQMQLPLRRPPRSPHSISAFECDSDDCQDDLGRDGGRRWWSRSDEEGRGSVSSEVPSVYRRRQEEEKERPPGSSSSSGGGVKGLFANARDRSWRSHPDRRRVNLRKSIKVLNASELDEGSTKEGATEEGGAQTEAPKSTNKSKRLNLRQVRNLESYFDGPGVFL
ncbi:hypothetical protein ISF_00935 [Cordyceps fumosorosea ARSEF 2679]|uniref:Uncharacterized protein n=1 Tax=Cordyceps fumosorosea (strain ARSEF 2679) TaxID=1081104 RepID=A0A162LQ75_CORFA|nr:hypothetical protein ISF_00935 [Cordyceps fumosorosea ARSEF 2679]OAA74034.1 hypothetical protein ISF_00935 [Cordyceps fumosorosea ARSEF 2679]